MDLALSLAFVPDPGKILRIPPDPDPQPWKVLLMMKSILEVFYNLFTFAGIRTTVQKPPAVDCQA